MPRPLATLLGLAALSSPAGPGVAQAADPVGTIVQTGRYEGGQNVWLGRDAAGRTVCYRREEGDSHRLDIGVGPSGAFTRLDTSEPRETTAREPIRVFAGRREQGGRFTVLAPFGGATSFHVPRPDQSGFVLVAGSRTAFLAVVAAARKQFLVIESRQPPVAREYVAVYEFDRAAADAVLACATRHVR